MANNSAVTIEPIDIRNYVVIESSDLDSANDDGSITVEANSTETIVEYEPSQGDVQVLLHALGAANATDVQYRLMYGQNISHTTESPPGSINTPFSFTKEFGAPITSDDLVQYVAINNTDSDVDLAARLHLEVVPEEDYEFALGQRGV